MAMNKAENKSNKSVMTPCRRIGLSRTRKTPTNVCLNDVNTKLTNEVKQLITTPVSNDEATITPKKVSLRINNNSSTPYRIGLSRKRKTSSKSPLVDVTMTNLDKTPTHVRDNVEAKLPMLDTLNFTPVAHRNKLKRINICENFDDEIRVQRKIKSKSKHDAKNSNNLELCLKSQEDMNISSSEDCDVKINITDNFNQPVELTINSKITDYEQLHNSKKIHPKSIITDVKISRKNLDQENIVQNSDKQIKLRKRLSLKKSDSYCGSDLIDNDKQLQNDIDINQSNVTVEKFDVGPKGIIDKILEKEKSVHEKETFLAKLKHVEVYQKLHNLEDLCQVTNVWKNSCEMALRDLLVKLKEHAAIDMSILLLNLKVPQDLLCYNVENDSFM